MVLSLVKGQKIDLTKNNPDLHLIHIGLYWRAPTGLDIDVSAFMVGQDEKIVREEDFVFYGQTRSSNGSVSLEESISTIEKQHFRIDLLKVPADVEKIAFTLTIYESEINGHTFEEVTDVQLRIVNNRRQEEVATFPIDYSFTKESAIVLGAIYRYTGEWKFQAVGAGFFGGLADLCYEYGVEVDDQPNEEFQGQVQANSSQESPNQRFQVVQERNGTEAGEEIPKPHAENIQLKRSGLVQFNDNRIEALSQQSDHLIHLFDDQDEGATTASTPKTADTPSSLALFMDDTNEGDYEDFIRSLSDVEKSFLLTTENGQISLDQAKTFFKQQGIMMAFFINTINEKANEHLDDNLLEMHPESVVVFDEFEPLVAKIKERVINEH